MLVLDFIQLRRRVLWDLVKEEKGRDDFIVGLLFFDIWKAVDDLLKLEETVFNVGTYKLCIQLSFFS